MACGACGSKYPGTISTPPGTNAPSYIQGGGRYVILNPVPTPPVVTTSTQPVVISPTPVQLPKQT